ncbi:MAG: hypothetical protein QXR81_06210 [Candidatus Nezhaarchaeales archaeon]
MAKGEARFKRYLKLRYGCYCFLGPFRVLKRLKLGSKGWGEVNG